MVATEHKAWANTMVGYQRRRDSTILSLHAERIIKTNIKIGCQIYTRTHTHPHRKRRTA